MTYPLTTTLNRIYACAPSVDGWCKDLAAAAGKTQGDDEPITYNQILDAVGIQNAIWCFRSEPQHSRLWRLYAVWCARRVQHLMTDPQSVAALDVAERHANGLATDVELAAAEAAAGDAAKAAAWDAAWDAATPAAWAAARDAGVAACYAAGGAAWAAGWGAGVAARNAALAAARNAAEAAAWAAGVAACDAAWAAALAAEHHAQADAFRQLVTTGTLP